MFKSRYGIIFVFCLISMICFTLMRVVFYVDSWNVVDHSLLHTLGVFGVGLVYDGVFNLYVGLFFAVLLFIIPKQGLEQQHFSVRHLSVLFLFSLLSLFLTGRRMVFLGRIQDPVQFHCRRLSGLPP